MKKKVPGLGLGSVFRRRRNNNKGDAAAAAAANDAKHEHRPAIDRVSTTVHHGRRPDPSLKVIDVAGGRSNGAAATVSTLTNDRPEATMKMSERLIQEATDDTSARTVYKDVGREAVGIDHLSMREQMWYKNQMYLLAKQQNELTPPRTHRISTRYESNDRDVDRFTARISPEDRNSPKGVAEFEDEFKSTDMHKNVDSRKEVRFHTKNDHDQMSQNDQDDNLTTQSSSLFGHQDASTIQSSTSSDGDTRTTYKSNSLIHGDDTITVTDGTLVTEVTLGSILDEAILEETTLDDGQSYLTSQTDGTSYKFQMHDDGSPHRKYRYGMGQNKLRRGTTVAAGPSILSKGTSTGDRRVTEIAPRDSDFTVDGEEEGTCPLLPAIFKEVSETVDDAKSALNQVLYAFFISDDDIDRFADNLRDAKLEVVEMIDQELNGGSSRRCSPRSVARETLL